MAVSEPLARPAAEAPRVALRRAVLKTGNRWLYIVHRWIGIVTCLFCAMWFVSGVVMMYVPFPGQSEAERLAASELLDTRALAVSPDAAIAAAGLKSPPTTFRLTMLEGRPVYRFVDGKRRVSISGVDGRRIAPVDAAAALRIVRRLHPDARSPRATTLVRDQWTVAQGFDPHRPLHRVDLGDAAATSLYVSSKTGEIVDDTTRAERLWNWVGAVPHWLYFTAIRTDGAFWRQVVMWTSGPTLVGALLGIWVGILRLRTRRRYARDRMSPYAGWMKWHHWSGLIAGAFVATWLFSGWLSVNPFHWFERAPASRAGTLAYLGAGGGPAGGRTAFLPDLAAFAQLSSSGGREARFTWLGGRPIVVLTDAELHATTLDGATGALRAVSFGEIETAATRLTPGGRLTRLVRLTAEDDYWYSHHVRRRLPVLRAVYDDAARTWVHLDPDTGEVLGRTTASGRLYRWLFNALHDFDLRFLLHHRPLWDLVVWALSVGGLIVSISGVVIGWRRLGRKLSPKGAGVPSGS